MNEFKLKSEYSPRGDQPKAIEELSQGILDGLREQTLLGVTGSGKTFTVANIIERVQKPTLVIAHNKTLAAQLTAELKEFFPDSAVEYFVSFYDFYQPEAYVASSDTFIEKDASINDEINKLRHSATSALFERKDVIIVASVSCIYGLGDPIDYEKLMLSLRPGMQKDREEVIRALIDIQFERNDIKFTRGTFRVKGDIIEIFPASSDENSIRVEFFGDEIDRITEVNYLTGEIIGLRNHVSIFPASHFVSSPEKVERAIKTIEIELQERLKVLESEDKLVEAQRLQQRTMYDIEMLREMGYCQGIENYSRHISGRPAGSKPDTLIDYFPEDFLMVVDESHVTLPQIRGMFAGDKARKTNLVEYGFRLPSALDNRPLRFDEFENHINQVLFLSATPGPYEFEHSQKIVEQIIRPTGLLDPIIEVRPTKNQIDDLIKEINIRVEKKEKVLITTLTKKMSEDLSKYFEEIGVRAEYLHSDVKTIERMEIIRDLRLDKFDALIGINLLREGLDIPEVSLVAILDADKEGFLRSETAMVQTIGRAARNENGRVLMYADKITNSMDRAISETNRRRLIQNEYNIEHDITPMTIKKGVRDVIEATKVAEEVEKYGLDTSGKITAKVLKETMANMEIEMMEAAETLQFERAAELRDKIAEFKKKLEK